MVNISDLLRQKGTSPRQISKITGAPYTSLMNSTNLPVEKWKISTLNTFAKGLNLNSGQLLNLLQDKSLDSINYNDTELTLNGYKFNKDDSGLYEIIKKVVLNNSITGYIPSSNEIDQILSNLKSTDAETYAKWRNTQKNKLVMEVISYLKFRNTH